MKQIRLNTNVALAGLALISFLAPALAAAQSASRLELIQAMIDAKPSSAPVEVELSDPMQANPWLSYTPGDQKVDWHYWQNMARQGSQERQNANAFSRQQLNSFYWHNDFIFLPRLGTRPWQDGDVQLSGEFDLPEPAAAEPFPEDEGSIPLATEVSVASGGAVRLMSFIGDGAFGSEGTESGDVDFYAVRGVQAGQTILVDLDTPIPFGDLDPVVEIWNSSGEFLAGNDDGNPAESFDSFIEFVAPADDDYFVAIAGFGTFGLADPFDSSSGLGDIFGIGLSEGEYTITIGLDYFDERKVLFFGRPGDALGGAIDLAGVSLSLTDSRGDLRIGSQQDITAFIPPTSPLPSGVSSFQHVVDTFGLYELSLRGSVAGAFTLDLVAALPALRQQNLGAVQTIFVDFDGEVVDLSESLAPNAPPGTLIADLSPLSAFLPNWGLTAADEDAVIDSIMAVVKQSLKRDIRSMGGSRKFDIRLLNSRDHKDVFGEENVSRVIVGGTVDELGVLTIGIAQSIDPGNFDTEETAFVLLDFLSSTDESSTISLNNFERAPGVSIIDIVGVGVGEIVAHEAGHYLGNWHTDTFNEQLNIMDAGGDIANTVLGIGEDDIFGSEDDIDVMFGRDTFSPGEGYSGIENTLTTIARGASRPSLLDVILRHHHGHSIDEDMERDGIFVDDQSGEVILVPEVE